MKPSRQVRTKMTGIVLGLVGTLIAGVGFYYGVYDRIEWASVDLRFRLRNKYQSGIKDSNRLCIVGIDDGSLASIGDWPWPRTHYAKIINLLNELECRQILIDLVFSMPKSDDTPSASSENEPGGELSEDDALVQAVREQERVILSTAFYSGTSDTQLVDDLIANFNLPMETLVQRAGGWERISKTGFVAAYRQAARTLVREVLVQEPNLTRGEVVAKILGKDWANLDDARRQLDQAYDYIQAYLQVRSKGGWMIDRNQRPTPVKWVDEDAEMVVPIAKLAAACQDLGFVNFTRDADGTIREISLLNYYDGMIYRQLAVAAACQSLQIEPQNFRIGSDRIHLLGGRTGRTDKVVLKSADAEGIEIPLTQDGKMVLNWRSPVPKRWDKSFRNMVSAGRVLEVAWNQELLRARKRMLADALPIIVEHFLKDLYPEYTRLTKLLPTLRDSVGDALKQETTSSAATRPAVDSEDEPAAETTSQPAPASAPADTVEQDLVRTFHETRKRIETIEAQAREQLDWMYGQLPTAPDQKMDDDARLVRELWMIVHRPEEVKRKNRELEAEVRQKVRELSAMVRDKIVLIGYTATTSADFVATPVFDHCPGVLVHATLLNQILERSFLTKAERNGDLLVILVIGTLMSILAAQRPALEGLVWMVFMTVGFAFGTCFLVFGKLGIVSSMVGPLLAVVLSWSLVNFYRHLTERRSKRIFADRLSQYTNPALARRIAESPDSLELIPEQRKVTCFFCDVAGFTPLSEKLGPQRTVQLLNLYLEHMSEIFDRHEAFINKFLGDGIFVFFNPPLHQQDDHARRACLAAIDVQAALPHVQKRLDELGFDLKTPLHVRVGISTGPAVVGDCGSKRKFDYTCLGDTVNLAARLEPANKVFGTAVLICDETRREMGEDLFTRLLGKIQVPGREQSVVVHELIGYRQDHEDQIESAEQFEDMVIDYWDQKFDKVRQALTHLEKSRPTDPAVKIYRRLLDTIDRTPDHFHDGVIVIETK